MQQGLRLLIGIEIEREGYNRAQCLLGGSGDLVSR